MTEYNKPHDVHPNPIESKNDRYYGRPSGSDGIDIDVTAGRLKSEYDAASRNKQFALESNERLQRDRQMINDLRIEARERGDSSSATYVMLNERLDDIGKRLNETSDDYRNNKKFESAALWDSREHYMENQSEYVQQAIIDAVRAGHVITIDGVTYQASDSEIKSSDDSENEPLQTVGS